MKLWMILAEDLFWLHVIIVFLYGALMGSFFNVCIYRLPLGRSVNQPRRSFCPSCGTMIAWYDNIPLYSYLRLRGICRHCGSRFSSRYFWIELLTALLFVGVFWRHRYTAATPMFLLLTSFLIISTFTDLDHWIIPDVISLGGALVGLLASLAVAIYASVGGRPDAAQSIAPYVAWPFGRMGPWGIAANSVAGAAFGYAVLWLIGAFGTLIFRKEAMGMGDMKLFACIGAFMGWAASLLVLALASFIGATMGLSLIAAQWIVGRLSPAVPGPDGPETPALSEPREASNEEGETPGETPAAAATPPGRRLHHLPFGPYIAVAAYLVSLFHAAIMKWLVGHLLIGGLY